MWLCGRVTPPLQPSWKVLGEQDEDFLDRAYAGIMRAEIPPPREARIGTQTFG
jgi:hypothetical protein